MAAPAWPSRLPVIGVPVSRTDYDEAVDCLIEAAGQGRAALATAFAVHGVVEAARDPVFRQRIESFELVTPDGQPVRLALNLLHGAGLADRVYGPDLTLHLCARAAREGIKVYFYGSTEETVNRLARRMRARFPALKVAGAEPSLFRPLSRQDSEELAQRVKASGARIVFIGLGCPRQENFAFEHRDILGCVQVCVGAAFDFHAGIKRQAPAWMQRASLEWLFRLGQEPRRLFRRYAITNSFFVWRLVQSRLFHRDRRLLAGIGA